MIPATAYAEFLEREYLDGFVADGGAAVKFLVPADEHEADRVHGYQCADSWGR